MFRADASQLNVLGHEVQQHLAQWPEPPGPPIPVLDSACQHVVLNGKPIVVPDATADPVMCFLPGAQIFHAYLDAPVAYNEQVIGSLCVVSIRPREWTEMEALALEAMARLVGQSLD